MQRTLKRVLDTELAKTITVEELLAADAREYNEIRRAALESHRSGHARYLCEKCGHAAYGPKEPHNKRPYWKHFKGAPVDCEWWTGTPLSIDQIGARQFGGRQESRLHLWLKQVIGEVLQTDDWVTSDSVVIDKYELFDGDKRKPDVRCTYLEKPIAIEIQLSTTSLPVIVGREAFYREHGRHLLWLTWNFEPLEFSKIRTAFQDIFFSHSEVIFSFDDECLRQSREHKKLMIRALWLRDQEWSTKVINLDELTWLPNGLPTYVEPWHQQMRRRWRQLGKHPARQDQMILINEITSKLGLRDQTIDTLCESGAIRMIDVLTSLEAGYPIASNQHTNIELINTFLNPTKQFKFATLLIVAIEDSGNSAFLTVPSIKRKLQAAESTKQVGKKSVEGKIAIALFPEWFKVTRTKILENAQPDRETLDPPPSPH